MEPYYVLACAVLVVHVLFIVWVIFGAALTAHRGVLGWLHIGSLLWGVWIEAAPWPCPLTYAENWFELRAGLQAYRGGFLLHYLDRIVYPNIPPAWLTEAAVIVALANAAIYGRRFWRARKRSKK
jgi:Protein of Unknown function (DUF2784)